MNLKRLEIAGFKSFATRTTFEFCQGITAIVGPNGSGKSNIADALRWVLGEQSGRLLRARKLEDSIFAGSSKRQPAEKADVSITLDNDDGWLPLDFAEVSISRRAYRSGESDYRINRKRVRLRDLQDLLLRAKAGQNSYAIIGQGLVETILNLRPEDRRQLIEEAADTQRYRLKIEEAQGKLAATGENMERVKLLIKEISPRLAALERQAKRAARHSDLSQELGQALQAWYGHHWHQAQEGLAVARSNHDQAQAEETQVRLAVDTCQRDLDDIAAELEQRRSTTTAALAERERLTARGQELEQVLAIAQQRRAILEARKEELTEELTASQKERSQAAEAAQGQEERCQAIEGELTAGRQALEERSRELAALEEEFRGLQDNAAAAAEKAARLETAASDLQARSQGLVRGHSDIAKDLSRLETRRRSLISQMAETVRVLRNMRAQEMEAAGSVLETVGQRDALDAQASDLRASLISLESKQQARRGKLEALRARLQVLQEAQERYRTAAEEAEPEMDIEGFVAAVHEILRVPRGLETAIESVLADYVEGVIVSQPEDALAAAQAIAQQGLARTFVLPLNSVKSTYPLNILKERGVRGVASKLVKCDPRFQRIVDALLGRVIVVDDVATAARVQRRGMGTVVTLDGVVFHPLGSLSAGFPKVSQPHILGHERDLEAIPKEIERTERSLALTQREVDLLQARLQEMEAALTNLTKDVDAAQGKRIRIQESMAGRQQRLAQLRGELRGLIASRDRLTEQSQGFDQESERLQTERERMLAEAKESQQSSRYLQQAGKMVDQRRSALIQAVNEANAGVAKLDGEAQSLAAIRQASESTLARLDSQLSAKQIQLNGLEMELASLNASIETDEKELAQARERLQAFLDSRQPDQETIDQMESRQRELQTQLLANQSRRLQTERRFLEAEAEVRRWETELATLRQRMEDDALTVTDDGEIISLREVADRIPYWLASESDAQSSSEGQQGDIKPISGGAIIDPQTLGQQIDSLRGQIRQLGAVNVEAQEEYGQLKERHDFLTSQLADLQGAETALLRAIDELTKVMQRRFEATFAQVAEGFSRYFEQFFGGGHAELTMSDGGDHKAAGVEIAARPPGKRVQGLAQLSGGEKALTSVSLLFALLQTNPSPFCVLDEVDAMLDDVNVGRFLDALKELAQETQFIVITHNRKTIEMADTIYGVSMGPDNTSRVLSLRLSDVAAN